MNKQTETYVMYGALTEGVHLAGFSFRRATDTLIRLLREDRWKLLGFDRVEDFLENVNLGGLRPSVDKRKEFHREIKRITNASNRKIAAVTGTSYETVRRDTAANAAPGAKSEHEPKPDKSRPNNDLKDSASEPADPDFDTFVSPAPNPEAEPQPDKSNADNDLPESASEPAVGENAPNVPNGAPEQAPEGTAPLCPTCGQPL